MVRVEETVHSLRTHLGTKSSAIKLEFSRGSSVFLHYSSCLSAARLAVRREDRVRARARVRVFNDKWRSGEGIDIYGIAPYKQGN